MKTTLKDSNLFNDNATIKVIGVGGAGNNTIHTMQKKNIQGVQLFVANTDKQALDCSSCKNKILLGKNITGGLGAGANPQVGARAANENINDLRKIVENTDIVFITCGMGGGTGTGAAPVIAKIAKESGALTIGVVTKPFSFEGSKRTKQAIEGVEELKENVDSIVIVSNNQLTEILGRRPISESFSAADNVLSQGVETITDLILKDSLINLDFNDIKSVMKDKGMALIGIGTANGDNAAIVAAEQAVNSPLLETKLSEATDAIVNITGGENMSLFDANDAVDTIKSKVGADLDIIFGVRIIPGMEDDIQVTLIATGFEKNEINDFAPKQIKTVKEEKEEIFPDFKSKTTPSPLFNKKEITERPIHAKHNIDGSYDVTDLLNQINYGEQLWLKENQELPEEKELVYVQRKEENKTLSTGKLNKFKGLFSLED